MAKRALTGCLAVASLIASGLMTLGSSATADVVTPTVQQLPVTRSGVTLAAEYCGTGALTARNDSATTVVIAIHGDSRTACDTARYVAEAAADTGLASSTLVVAPHFYAASDPVPAQTLYWDDSGWKSGGNSLTAPAARPWTISSFEVLDLLVRAAADRAVLPNVRRIVVAGHSAGGQAANRYAATTAVPASATPGIERPFVVANPSSYVYFTPQRYAGGQWRSLTSAETSSCSGFDRYKYGLQRRSGYAARLTSAQVATQYASADVRYLLGTADTSTTDPSLDTSCGANWQGRFRLERGRQYFAGLGTVFGTGVYDRHHKLEVPNVGHSARSMYRSQEGRYALFS